MEELWVLPARCAVSQRPRGLGEVSGEFFKLMSFAGYGAHDADSCAVQATEERADHLAQYRGDAG